MLNECQKEAVIATIKDVMWGILLAIGAILCFLFVMIVLHAVGMMISKWFPPATIEIPGRIVIFGIVGVIILYAGVVAIRRQYTRNFEHCRWMQEQGKSP